MSRMSSPNSYLTTWSNSMPRPRNTEKYSPMSWFSTSCSRRHSRRRSNLAEETRRGVMARTQRPGSRGAAAELGHGFFFHDLLQHVLGRHFVGLGFVSETHAM